MPSLSDRARGCLLGLAAGNMLGLPLEFVLHRRKDRVTDIDPAEIRKPWDDDLAQAFELGQSLAALRRADPRDLANRFLKWARSNGRGMGSQTRKVLRLIEKGFAPLDASRQVWEASACRAAGNGAVMRCAPAALAFHDDPAALARAALDSAAVTHFDPRCTQGALAQCAAVAALLHDEDPLQTALDALRAQPKPDPELLEALTAIPRTILDDLPIREPDAIGYTVTCTRTALWAAVQPGSLETILLDVVNECGDADTNGAAAGAILGARFGVDAIPKRWRERIRGVEELEKLADGLIRR